MKKVNDSEAVPMLFLVPAADPAVKRDQVGARIVPPAQPFDPGPVGIDPVTGLPIVPGIPPGGGPGIDPATGLLWSKPWRGINLSVNTWFRCGIECHTNT